MRRRDFLVSAIVTLGALAVHAAAPVRIGFASGGDEKGAKDLVAALRDGLAAAGYREPEALSLDLLYADYMLERIPTLVAELERRRVALIVTHAAATPLVVKGKHTVPVV